MRPTCLNCCQNPKFGSSVVRYSQFFRKSDSQYIQRFKCNSCGKHFSKATSDPCFRQNKRRINHQLYKLLHSGVSMREAARLLHIHRTTVARKKSFLALRANDWLLKFRKDRLFNHIQFDDMETFEHSKCKPLSITLMVEYKSRLIIGYKVAQMPAKGLLAKRALRKYGYRPDHRKMKRRRLFREVKKRIHPNATIHSDMNPHYEADVREYFPRAEHLVYKGRRGCVVGQGELKAGGYDPLFSLNHTCAMLRANINRLFRRTWCTTKTVKGLEEHIAIYAKSHNERILKKKAA